MKHCLAHKWFLWAFSTCVRSHDYTQMSCLQCTNRPSCKTVNSTQGTKQMSAWAFMLYFQTLVHVSKELSVVLEHQCSQWLTAFFLLPILFLYVHNWVPFLCVWGSLRGSRMWWIRDHSHKLGATSLASRLARGACKDWADVVLLCRSLG